MDGMNNENVNSVHKYYEKLTYYDIYTTDIIVFVCVTVFFLYAVAYCSVMMYSTEIQDDWPNQRCNPLIMPFAGTINAPTGTSSSTYTSDNFNYCTQQVVSDALTVATMPVQFIINSLLTLVNILHESIDNIRSMMSKVRNELKEVSQEVMGRMGNIMIPMQQILIKMRDFLGKVQGTIVAAMFTSLGSYYTLQSLMGAIVEFIVMILIALSVTIAIMWAVPFTWGAAASMTVMYLAISIPMMIVLVFLQDVLKVNSGLKIPKIKCFDEFTKVGIFQKTSKCIKDIKIGDILKDNSRVTAIVKVLKEGSIMYELNGVIVSDTHIVNHESNWVRVSEHPLAKKINKYDNKYLYCLNTTSKTISANDIEFTDWDELYGRKLIEIHDFVRTNGSHPDTLSNIHKYLDVGLYPTTQITLNDGTRTAIKNIKVNDVLYNNIVVYGLVKIDGLHLESNHASSTSCCVSERYQTFTNGERKIVRNTSNITVKYLYHLLTNPGYFYVNETCVSDYNAAIDYFNG